MALKDRWNKRDQQTIDNYFGCVDGFTQYTDHILMIEAPHGRAEALVDYRWVDSTSNLIGCHAEVIWDYNGSVNGRVGNRQCYSETELLSELYWTLGLHRGRIPPAVDSIPDDVDRYMWLSNRHREYDYRMYCIDIDAFSMLSDSSEIIVWDLKHANGRRSSFESCVLGTIDWPTYKIDYSFATSDWLCKCEEDYVIISPANETGWVLADEEGGNYDVKLSVDEAVDQMNRLVQMREKYLDY